MRRRVQVGLNKGEARNAWARAVFFNRLGEARDRSFEQQRYRASGLNLVTAAIMLWNTTYLERAARTLVTPETPDDENLLQYLSPPRAPRPKLHSPRVRPSGEFSIHPLGELLRSTQFCSLLNW